ncbi:hypothetical protein EYF80_023980 [Liparis tanakae]|uniref:Secreted protein n=1 Tax=Liparis tanakae TaxID=230148 RepID=A0A4Z2HJ44_9TELE|nr:hypothetical protein EYF80_023980 [Liparis tanakae]
MAPVSLHFLSLIVHSLHLPSATPLIASPAPVVSACVSFPCGQLFLLYKTLFKFKVSQEEAPLLNFGMNRNQREQNPRTPVLARLTAGRSDSYCGFIWFTATVFPRALRGE